MGLWFSVYEEILTDPKIRHAAKLLKTSECEILGSLTFIWGWGLSNTDQDGRILHAGVDDLADVIRIRVRRQGGPEPEDVIRALIEAEFIDVIDGDLYIHNWGERQKFFHRFEQKRKVDKERHRKNATEKKDVPVETKKEPESKPAISGYSPEFEEFWMEYPRKAGKGEAYKKYQARLKDGFSPEELKAAAKNYSAECKRNRTEQKYIKHGKTFLSDATPFLDYLPKQPQPAQVGMDDDPFAEWRQ